jgi:uncharacterized protein (TIGR03067 family)
MRDGITAFGRAAWLTMSMASFSLADGAAADLVAQDKAAYAGTWRVVTIEADGNEQDARDRAIVVINHEDGSWTLSMDGREVSSGTSRMDPLATPSEIDLEVTAGDGVGSMLLGIYELDGNRRRLCFRGADGWRPREFATSPGSRAVLVEFERE